MVSGLQSEQYLLSRGEITSKIVRFSQRHKEYQLDCKLETGMLVCTENSILDIWNIVWSDENWKT